jgi:hypothetical protein
MCDDFCAERVVVRCRPAEWILTMAYVTGWLVVITLFLVIPASWAIFRKAGFHPGLSVLTLFPLINVFVLYYVALSNGRPVLLNLILSGRIRGIRSEGSRPDLAG